MSTQKPQPPHIDEVLFAILEDYTLFELKNSPHVKDEIKFLYALNDREAECLMKACWEIQNGRKLPKCYREHFEAELWAYVLCGLQIWLILPKRIQNTAHLINNNNQLPLWFYVGKLF